MLGSYPAAAFTLLFGALLACGSGSKHTCRAAIELDGKRSYAIADGEEKMALSAKAVEGACGWHCQDFNPTLQAAYRKLRSSSTDPPPTRGAMGLDPEIKRLIFVCQTDCQRRLAGGQGRKKVECL